MAERNWGVRMARVARSVGLSWLLTGCAFAHVGSGEVAVVRTPDGVQKKVYSAGDWQIGTWDTPINYSIRSQGRDERLEVLASNGLRITLDTSIRYHIVANDAVALDEELGPDYYAILLGPTLRSQARRVVGRFTPEEIYSTQRELIERQVREGIETAIKDRHLVLEAVLIRNVTLPEPIQAAITTKLEAEQQALKMKYIIEETEAEEQKELIQAKADVERKKIAAQGEAETSRLQAQGLADSTTLEAKAQADAKELDGKATADYEKLVQSSLTPGILELRRIEAAKSLAESSSSKFVLTGGSHSFFDLDSLFGGKDRGAASTYP